MLIRSLGGLWPFRPRAEAGTIAGIAIAAALPRINWRREMRRCSFVIEISFEVIVLRSMPDGESTASVGFTIF
jgi:hypothetical protein